MNTSHRETGSLFGETSRKRNGGGTPWEGRHTSSHPVTILLVEDELIVAEDIRRRLTAMGYSVVDCSTTGEGAIAQAETFRPDIVLMDIGLRGGMDGVEAAGAIRSRLGIPVVYLTGHGDPDTLQRAKATEDFAFVLKPVDDRELRYVVEMALRRRSMTQPQR